MKREPISPSLKTLRKIERNTDRIATALERLSELFTACSFESSGHGWHNRRGPRYLRVDSSND